MRSALAITTVLFAALSGFLLMEVRDTWSSFTSMAVDEAGGSLRISLRLREMLDAGEIEAAILQLEKNQTAEEFKLSEIVTEIRSPSWRWGDQSENLRKAQQYQNAK